MLDMNTYRVIIYSEDNETFGADDAILTFQASSMYVVAEDDRSFRIVNAYAVDGNNEEVRFDDAEIAFTQSTGISDAFLTYAVKGGDCITVTALEAQEIAVYSVDGRLVRKVQVNAGTTRIAVPAGVYVVNGEKVLVK